MTDSPSGESCASLAYWLLVGGGLTNLLGSGPSSKVSVVATPNKLKEIAIKAKKAELKDHPETAAFEYEDETPINSDGNRLCLVM